MRTGKNVDGSGVWWKRGRIIVLSILVALLMLFGVTGGFDKVLAEPDTEAGHVTGEVIRPDQSPIVGDVDVRLSARPDSWDYWEIFSRTNVTAHNDGRFTFDLSALSSSHFPVDAYVQAEGEGGYFRSVPQPVYISDYSSTVSVGPITLTYASFTGTVYEPDGVTPVAEGFVNVLGEMGPNNWVPVAYAYYTDGLYAVGGVPSGSGMKLVADFPRDSIYWASEPQAVTVTEGSQYSNDPAVYTFTLQQPNLTSTVRYPNGQPATWHMSGTEMLGHAWVVAESDDCLIIQDRSTASSGEVGFRLPDGQYSLRAYPEGSMKITYTNSVPQFVSVSETMALQSGAAAAGSLTLTYPSVIGHVLKPDGTPVQACVDVWLEQNNGPSVIGDWWLCDGAPFILGGVPTGNYWLKTYVDPQTGLFPGDPVSVVIAPGSQYTANGTQWISPTLHTHQVSVSVRRMESTEWLDVSGWVHLWNDGTDQWAYSAPGTPAYFGNLGTGTYQMKAWPDSTDIPTWGNSARKTFTIDATSTPQAHALTLRRSNVVGVVQTPEGLPLPMTFDASSETGEDTAAAQFHNDDWTVDLTAPVNASGYFGAVLPDGKDELVVEPLETLALTYTKSRPMSFSIVHDVTQTVKDLGTISLTYPRLTGKVFDPSGMPVETGVGLWNADGSYVEWVTSHADDGFFRFGGLPDGSYVVRADPPVPNTQGWGSSASYAFTVPPVGTEAINLHLQQANILGHLTYPNDAACPYCSVPDVDVRVRDEAWTFEDWQTTDVNGAFAFAGLVPGEYVLDFFLPTWLETDWRSPSGPVTVSLPTSSTQQNLYYELEPVVHNKRVIGHVVLEDGRPITDTDGDLQGDAWIDAYHVDTGKFQGTTSDPTEGTYQLDLQAGTWKLDVMPATPDAAWYFDPDLARTVAFTLAETVPETRTIVFTVTEATYYNVTGMISDDQGHPPATQDIWIDLCTDEGHCFSDQVSTEGSFAVRALPGAYRLWVWVDPESGWIPPAENGHSLFVDGDV